MELELEKTCKISDMVVGQRYCNHKRLTSYFTFIVTAKSPNFVDVVYTDGVVGVFTIYGNDNEVYEFPFSELEKELK